MTSIEVCSLCLIKKKKKDMGHLMDVSVELQYLFYPLHQMHNV